MKKEKKSAITNIVIGALGFLILFFKSIMNELTDTQSLLLAVAMMIFGILFVVGLMNLSAINSSRKK